MLGPVAVLKGWRGLYYGSDSEPRHLPQPDTKQPIPRRPKCQERDWIHKQMRGVCIEKVN